MNLGIIAAGALGLFVLFAWLMFHARAFPLIVKEIFFYHKMGWNFQKDSGNKVFAQDQMITKFRFLPPGLVKLLILFIQIIFFAMPFMAAFNSYITQNNLINH